MLVVGVAFVCWWAGTGDFSLHEGYGMLSTSDEADGQRALVLPMLFDRDESEAGAMLRCSEGLVGFTVDSLGV